MDQKKNKINNYNLRIYIFEHNIFIKYKKYKFRISKYPILQCFHFRENLKWKSMLYFDLDLKRKILLFIDYQFLSNLEVRGFYLQVYDFRKEVRKEKRLFRVDYRRNLWYTWETLFKTFFLGFKSEDLKLIESFCPADGLQSRLLREHTKDPDFIHLIKNNPFLAYQRVLLSHFKFEDYPELSEMLELYERYFYKISPESLNFRYFGFFSQLIENPLIKEDIESLNSINLVKIHNELTQTNSSKKNFSSESLDIIAPISFNNLIRNLFKIPIYPKGSKRVGFGVKYFNFKLNIHVDICSLVSVKMRSYSKKFVFEYFDCLDVWRKAEGEVNWSLGDYSKDQVVQSIFNKEFERNAWHFYVNCYSIFEEFDKFSFYNTGNYLHDHPIRSIRFEYQSDRYKKEISKFRKNLPVMFVDALNKINESIACEYLDNDIDYSFQENGSEKGEFSNSLLYRLFLLMNQDLNFFELCLNSPKLAILLVSYFVDKGSNLNDFDRKLIFTFKKSELMEKVGISKELIPLVLKFSFRSLFEIPIDELVNIAKREFNQKILKKIQNISLVGSNILRLSSKNRFDNITFNLLKNVMETEKLYYEKNKFKPLIDTDSDSINPECDELEDLEYKLSQLEYDYLDASEISNGRVFFRSIEGIQDYLSANFYGDQFIEPTEFFEFPDPPLKGNEFILPITNSYDLYFESLIMRNCVFRSSYVDKILRRFLYIYSARMKERCLIAVLWEAENCDWSLLEVKTIGNSNPSEESLKLIQEWFENEKRRNYQYKLPFGSK